MITFPSQPHLQSYALQFTAFNQRVSLIIGFLLASFLELVLSGSIVQAVLVLSCGRRYCDFSQHLSI